MLDWWQTIRPILEALGAVVVGGSVVTGLALWLFKLFGEQWLSNRFAERLASFRHEQAKEIEQLKFEISKLLDRSTKLHQREFDVLPKAWALLINSYYTVMGAISALQTYPDINRMGDAQLDEFLAGVALQNWQKTELKAESDKQKYFENAIFWHRLNEARATSRKSSRYLLRNGIFMPVELREKFDEIETLSWNALTEHELNKTVGTIPRERTEYQKFFKDGQRLIKLLETEVHKRLWG